MELLYNYYNNSPDFSYFFSNFLSFDSCVFIFFVFCISSSNGNKLNSISCGICLSFKSRHLELFCKINIQLFSIGIFLGYDQEVHLATLQNNYFSCISVNGCFQSFTCDQNIRQVKNQIIKHQIQRKIKATRLMKFLSSFFK